LPASTRLPGIVVFGPALSPVAVSRGQRVFHFADDLIYILDYHRVFMVTIHNHLQRVAHMMVNVAYSAFPLAQQPHLFVLLVAPEEKQDTGGDAGDGHPEQVAL
jgi:hypothetical protein